MRHFPHRSIGDFLSLQRLNSEIHRSILHELYVFRLINNFLSHCIKNYLKDLQIYLKHPVISTVPDAPPGKTVFSNWSVYIKCLTCFPLSPSLLLDPDFSAAFYNYFLNIKDCHKIIAARWVR